MLPYRTVKALFALAFSVMVHLAVPPLALAQQAVDAGGDVGALRADVEQDYAATLANDCATACRALESMRHAADRICALDAGDACAEAQRKVSAAAERVRAVCPGCAQALGGAQPNAVPAPPSVRHGSAESLEEASPSKRGGCAGCTTASGRNDGVGLTLGAALAILATRRRRRQE